MFNGDGSAADYKEGSRQACIATLDVAHNLTLGVSLPPLKSFIMSSVRPTASAR